MKHNRVAYLQLRRSWFDSLKDQPCMDCGSTFPSICMQFDHVRGKKFKDVSELFQYSKVKVLEEVAKCDVVCANCHAIRTGKRAKRNQKMPYRSKAQQRLFHAKLNRGEISAATVKEFDQATNFKSLPERKSSPTRAARKPRKG